MSLAIWMPFYLLIQRQIADASRMQASVWSLWTRVGWIRWVGIPVAVSFLTIAATSLTWREWTSPPGQIRRWVVGAFVAWIGCTMGGITILLRAMSGSRTSDIKLLTVTQWSAKVMLSRLWRWSWKSIRYVGLPLGFLGSIALWIFAVPPGSRWDGVLTIAISLPMFALMPVLYVVPVALLFGGFTRNNIERHGANDGIRRAITTSGVSLFLLAIVVAALGGWAFTKHSGPLWTLASLVATVGANLVMANGGFDAVTHYVLRFMLARAEGVPMKLRRYLEAGAAAVLLQSVGGSYRFVHVLLRDVLAEEASLSRS